ncbi:MAG TPA: DMT family transporter [bacterium]|jgi:drug/metabolite transporter (DMT)-like permease
MPRRSAYLFLTFMALFFGGTWVAGKVGVEAIPPITLATGRFAIASLLLWLWARTKQPSGRAPRLSDLPLFLSMGLTAVAGYNMLFLYGLTLAPASDGAIIVPGLAPILTAVLAAILLKEHIGRWGVAGLLTALVGLLLVLTPGETQSRSRFLGDALFLGGALCWAIYVVIGKTATARFHPVNATLYGTVTGTLLLLPAAIIERGWTKLASAPPGAWISLLYLAVFGTVLAFVFFYEGVRRIGAARASAFAFLVPIFGVVSSVVLLGEHLAPATVLGGALVLVGLWLVQRQPGPAEASTAQTPAGTASDVSR